jgi:hypothetical protein
MPAQDDEEKTKLGMPNLPSNPGAVREARSDESHFLVTGAPIYWALWCARVFSNSGTRSLLRSQLPFGDLFAVLRFGGAPSQEAADVLCAFFAVSSQPFLQKCVAALSYSPPL